MIGFVRHGITEWNKEGRTQGKIDIPLNDEGIRMSEKLANRLGAETWSAIYTSPLQRAEQTARLIAHQQKHEAKVIVDKRLREIGEGKKEGTTQEERIKKWGVMWQEHQLDIEADAQVIERAKAFIEEVKTEHTNEKIVVVSHGSFIQRVCEILCPTVYLEEDIKNASLTIIMVDDENQWIIYNCVEHLKG